MQEWAVVADRMGSRCPPPTSHTPSGCLSFFGIHTFQHTGIGWLNLPYFGGGSTIIFSRLKSQNSNTSCVLLLFFFRARPWGRFAIGTMVWRSKFPACKAAYSPSVITIIGAWHMATVRGTVGAFGPQNERGHPHTWSQHKHIHHSFE